MLPVMRNTWMPEVFNDFFDTDFMPRTNATAPAINVKETEHDYTVVRAAEANAGHEEVVGSERGGYLCGRSGLLHVGEGSVVGQFRFRNDHFALTFNHQVAHFPSGGGSLGGRVSECNLNLLAVVGAEVLRVGHVFPVGASGVGGDGQFRPFSAFHLDEEAALLGGERNIALVDGVFEGHAQFAGLGEVKFGRNEP